MRSALARARLCLAGAALAVTPGTVAAAAVPGPGPATPPCAWPLMATPATDNQGTPDSSAAYWITPFTIQPGLRITLSGRYPDARYASLEVTKPGGGLFTTDGVSSELTDYRIAPDPGSANPWQDPARPHGHWAGGRFTVLVQPSAAPGQANTLPLAPAGTTSGTGYLLYRVYLPARGDFSRVPVPAITFTRDGISAQLPRCPAGTASGPGTSAAPAAPGTAGSPSAAVRFARPAPGSGAGISPNADTGYLFAEVTPPGAGDVVVIRGKAPTASHGSHPSPWPAPGTDMRYWSMCTNLATAQTPLVVNRLPGGGVDYGCRHDTQTTLDGRGYYTYVVGTEAQRAVIAKIPGTTFLPFSTAFPATPHILLLRNMLISPGFSQAVQDVRPDWSPASAAEVMGPYYPRAAVCPLRTLAVSGPLACLAGAP